MDSVLQPLVSLVQDLLQPFAREGAVELHAQAAVLLCALVGFALTSWLFRQAKAPTNNQAAPRPEVPAAVRRAGSPVHDASAGARNTTELGDGGAEEAAKKLAKVKRTTKKGKETSSETEELILAASSTPAVAPAPQRPQAASVPGREAPVLAFAGGRFSGAGFVDLRSPPHSLSTAIGGPMSVSFVARWDAFNTWSRIIDFGCGSVSDNVTIANFEKGKTLVADVYRGTSRKRLLMTSAISIGEMHRYLFTVNATGRMRMLRDGTLLGELAGGYVPREVERTHLYVGGSSWATDGLFQGCIANLCIWRGAVEWDTAFPADVVDLEEFEGLPQIAANMPSGGPARHAAEAVTATGLGAPASQAQSEEEMSERVAKLMAKKAERKARKAREKSEEEDAGATGLAPQEEADEERRVSGAAFPDSSKEEAAELDEAPAMQPEAAAQESFEPSSESPPEEPPSEEVSLGEVRPEEVLPVELPSEEVPERSSDAEVAEVPTEELPERSRETEVFAVKQAAPWRRPGERNAAWADLTEALEEAAEAEFEVPRFAPEPAVPAEEVRPPGDGAGEAEMASPAAQAEESVWRAAPRGGPATDDSDFEVVTSSRRRGGRGRGAGREGRAGGAGARATAEPTVEAAPPAETAEAEAATASRAPWRPSPDAPAAGAAPPVQRSPPAAAVARASHEPASEEPSAAPRTQLERDILKWEKKLREVERLKQRLADGEVLEPLQEAKLSRFGEIEQRLAELHAQRAAEQGEQAVPGQMEDYRNMQTPHPDFFATGGASGQRSGHGEPFHAVPWEPAPALLAPWGAATDSAGAPPVPPVGRTPLRAPPPGKEQWTPSGGGACLGKGLPLQWTAAAIRASPQGPGMPAPAPEADGALGGAFDGPAGPGPPAQQAYVPVGVFGGYPGGTAPPGQEDVDGHPDGGFDPMCQQQFFAPPGGFPSDPQAGFDPAMSGGGMEVGMDGPMMQVPGDAMPMEFVYSPPDVQLEDRWECCWEWIQTGWCPRGLTCRWEHPPLQPMDYAIYE